MKKLITLSTILVSLFLTQQAFAKIWRVNNTAGVNADFTGMQAAFDAASAGDTIHIEPSASGYGTGNVTKPLHIVGNGYFLTENGVLQANTNTSSINYISFSTGSANSVVQGLTATSFYVYTNNITIKRNYIGNWIYMYDGANNCTVSGNYFYYYGISHQNGTFNGMYIGNNIFNNYCSVGLGASVTGTFENNTCYAGGVDLYNFQVDNNIFTANCTWTPHNSVYFNNIGNTTQFGTANGNQQNINMANVFVGGSNDTAYVLKSGSPAIGAGYGGVDCGAYGNVNPYKISGIPNIPTIYQFTVPPVGTSNINVTVSTKSNN